MVYKSGLVLIVLLIFVIYSDFATGISMRNASIPHYAVRGGKAEFTCDFDLESDKLLNLKWYKDESEFFSFAGNFIQVFPVEGIHVDVQLSSQKILTLKNISLSTSGLYRCEILADKSFQRLTHQGQMIVVSPPPANPEIQVKGHGLNQSRVTIGERLIGNCTSRKSKPAAALMFYINGQKADYAEITEFSPVNETGGLETSILGFNFSLEALHFSKPDSRLELKCTSSIGNHYRVSVLEFLETRILAQPSSHRNQFSRAASTSFQQLCTILYPLLLVSGSLKTVFF